MVGEIKVVVLDRHDVARLGLASLLESADQASRARRVVLITGGGRDHGYLVLGDVTAESLRAALVSVLSGERRLPAEVTKDLLAVARGDGPAAPTVAPALSPQEDEVLELLVAGHSSQEIAAHLGISIHGAKRHVASILAKYDSPSRSHLVSRVLRSRERGSGRRRDQQVELTPGRLALVPGGVAEAGAAVDGEGQVEG